MEQKTSVSALADANTLLVASAGPRKQLRGPTEERGEPTQSTWECVLTDMFKASFCLNIKAKSLCLQLVDVFVVRGTVLPVTSANDLQVTSTWCRDLFWSLLIHNAHYIFTRLWTNNTVFWTRAEPTPLEQRDNFQETLQKFCFVSQKSFWDIYSRIKVFTMPRSAFPVARLPKDRITANGRDLAKQMELACFDRCELESLSVCLVHS